MFLSFKIWLTSMPGAAPLRAVALAAGSSVYWGRKPLANEVLRWAKLCFNSWLPQLNRPTDYIKLRILAVFLWSIPWPSVFLLDKQSTYSTHLNSTFILDPGLIMQWTPAGRLPQWPHGFLMVPFLSKRGWTIRRYQKLSKDEPTVLGSRCFLPRQHSPGDSKDPETPATAKSTGGMRKRALWVAQWSVKN